MARAHHGSGQDASESLRTLNAGGGTTVQRQRAALLFEGARSTEQPTLNQATSYTVSALGAFRVLPRLYVGAQSPLTVVDEDTRDPIVGYGDTRLWTQLQLGRPAQSEGTGPERPGQTGRNEFSGWLWTLGLNLSIPTRTFRFTTDPGRQWLVAPSVSLRRDLRRFGYSVIVMTPVESRPAGVALELSSLFSASYRLSKPLALNGGVGVDVRVLSVCRGPGETHVCSEGRASETDRPMGATRAYAHLGMVYDLSTDWSLFASAQLPLTQRRDIEWYGSLGVELRF